jgi:hypothetical protein
MDGASMITARMAITAATVLASLAVTAAFAQDDRVLRYGNTSGWSFDGRDDDRDSSSNGFFPGNFASDPSTAWIGAAGLLGSNPRRSATAYPSQIVVGSTGHHVHCPQGNRSYDPTSGTILGKDDLRHRC